MQGTGAYMLRIACCLATERGVEICAPVHDSLLIAAPLQDLDQAVATMQQAMREASAVVLSGFELSSDVKIVRYPDRYSDARGEVMWTRVMKLIGEVSETTIGGQDQGWCHRDVTGL
jgi:DNA polymerase I